MDARELDATTVAILVDAVDATASVEMSNPVNALDRVLLEMAAMLEEVVAWVVERTEA